MAELNITLDAKDIARLRRLAGVSRLMAAKALTFTAEKAVPAWRAGQSIFHKRNSWIDKGVRVKFATPSNLNAQVGSMDKFMGRHVVGVDNPKRAGRRSLFVPNQPVPQQPTHTRIRSQLRGFDRTKRKTFRVRGMIFRRLTKERDSIKLLGTLKRAVDIAPRLDAIGIVRPVVQREFPTIYERLLLKWARSGRA